MNTLFAVDSSGKTAGVCVLQDGAVLYERTLDEGLTHSETLLPLVQRALAATGLAPALVDTWAVTAGPGSFTGLRIGMALVKGLAFPSKAPAVPVSTLEALAWGCGLRGTVVTALDARRGEVYWAAFSCGDKVERLTPDAAENVACMAKIVQSAPAPVYFVGDGAEICYNQYNCGTNVRRPGGGQSMSIARGAAFLAQWVMAHGGPAPAEDMQPRYLRLSQAERERAAHTKETG